MHGQQNVKKKLETCFLDEKNNQAKKQQLAVSPFSGIWGSTTSQENEDISCSAAKN